MTRSIEVLPVYTRAQNAYSPTKDLAYSVSLSRNLSQHWLAMFTAYFDDSGSPDTGPEFVVAGYVAHAEQWIRFEREWNQILSNYDVACFHMKDFAHSRGVFEQFRGNESKRKEFLKKLVASIKVRVRKSFSCVVAPDDYWEVNENYLLRENLGNPYAFCGRHCVARVRMWANSFNYPEDSIRYVFEQGTRGKGELMQVMKRDGFPAPIFKPKSTAALQAADFVAWEHTKAFDSAQREFRRSLIALNRIPNDWGIYPRQRLVQLCRNSSFALRNPPPAPVDPNSKRRR